MIRRLNYTGRKRIPTGCVRIRVGEQVPARFDAEVQLQGLEFPADARVFLDVRQGASTASRRFDLGTAGRITVPQDRSLVGLEPESLYFELKVVEPTGNQVGRLLGQTSVIRPHRPGDPQEASILPLLPVRLVDLEAQVWNLSFDRVRPHLLLNNRIPGIHDIARTNGAFFGLVYPAVVRGILTRIVVIEDMTEPIEDDDESWTSLWLRWAIGRHPDQEPAAGDAVDRLEWVEAVVREFCSERTVLDLYVESFDPNGGEP